MLVPRLCFVLFALFVSSSVANAQLTAQAQWPGSPMPNVSTTFRFMAVQTINGQDVQTVETTDQYLDAGNATVTFNTIDPSYPTAIFAWSDPVSSGGKTYYVRRKLYSVVSAWTWSDAFAIQWIIN